MADYTDPNSPTAPGSSFNLWSSLLGPVLRAVLPPQIVGAGDTMQNVFSGIQAATLRNWANLEQDPAFNAMGYGARPAGAPAYPFPQVPASSLTPDDVQRLSSFGTTPPGSLANYQPVNRPVGLPPRILTAYDARTGLEQAQADAWRRFNTAPGPSDTPPYFPPVIGEPGHYRFLRTVRRDAKGNWLPDYGDPTIRPATGPVAPPPRVAAPPIPGQKTPPVSTTTPPVAATPGDLSVGGKLSPGQTIPAFTDSETGEQVPGGVAGADGVTVRGWNQRDYVRDPTTGQLYPAPNQGVGTGRQGADTPTTTTPTTTAPPATRAPAATTTTPPSTTPPTTQAPAAPPPGTVEAQPPAAGAPGAPAAPQAPASPDMQRLERLRPQFEQQQGGTPPAAGGMPVAPPPGGTPGAAYPSPAFTPTGEAAGEAVGRFLGRGPATPPRALTPPDTGPGIALPGPIGTAPGAETPVMPSVLSRALSVIGPRAAEAGGPPGGLQGGQPSGGQTAPPEPVPETPPPVPTSDVQPSVQLRADIAQAIAQNTNGIQNYLRSRPEYQSYTSMNDIPDSVLLKDGVAVAAGRMVERTRNIDIARAKAQSSPEERAKMDAADTAYKRLYQLYLANIPGTNLKGLDASIPTPTGPGASRTWSEFGPYFKELHEGGGPVGWIGTVGHASSRSGAGLPGAPPSMESVQQMAGRGGAPGLAATNFLQGHLVAIPIARALGASGRVNQRELALIQQYLIPSTDSFYEGNYQKLTNTLQVLDGIRRGLNVDQSKTGMTLMTGPDGQPHLVELGGAPTLAPAEQPPRIAVPGPIGGRMIGR
jgi:hypothetical protein